MRSKAKLFAAAIAVLAVGAGPTDAQVIESGSLQQLDAWAVGSTNDQRQLPRSLWASSEAAALGALFDRIPAELASPAAQWAVRQALLTPAQAPTGSSGAKVEAVRKRYEALARVGAAEELVNMVAGSGEAKSDANIAQFAVQAELARGRVQDACRRADSVDTIAPSKFLIRLRALCHAVAGDGEAADLALSIARDAQASDAWFESAVLHMIRPAARIPQAKYSNSLDAAVSLAANLRIPPRNALAGASSFSLAGVAQTENAPAALQAEAAIAALRRNAIAADAARAALRRAGAAQTGPTQVSLLVAVDLSDGPFGKATAIAGALGTAKSQQEFVAIARLFASDMASLPVTEAIAPSAPIFARANLALGEYRSARIWRNVFDPAQPDPKILGVIDLALAATTTGDASVVADQRIATAPTGTERLVSRDLRVMSALGLTIGENAAAFVERTPPATGRKLDAAVMPEFDAAVGRRAIGESVLLAALLVGPGAETLDADGLAAVLRGLKQVGAVHVARAIAVEAIIGGQAR